MLPFHFCLVYNKDKEPAPTGHMLLSLSQGAAFTGLFRKTEPYVGFMNRLTYTLYTNAVILSHKFLIQAETISRDMNFW